MSRSGFKHCLVNMNLEQRGQQSDKENDLKDGKEGNLIGPNIRGQGTGKKPAT
jgi:hypothetical protein